MTGLWVVAMVLMWMSGIALGCWAVNRVSDTQLHREDMAFAVIFGGMALVIAVMAGCL